MVKKLKLLIFKQIIVVFQIWLSFVYKFLCLTEMECQFSKFPKFQNCWGLLLRTLYMSLRERV